MDTRDGRIYTPEEHKSIKDFWDKVYHRPMEVPPTPKQMARKPPKVGRNEPCPCGSGKKFKKCCLLQTSRDKEV